MSDKAQVLETSPVRSAHRPPDAGQRALHPLLALQRAAGNQAVAALLKDRVARQRGRHPSGPSCPSITINLRPVFFRSSRSDPATGATWATRFAAANNLWGRCGIHFTAARPRTVTDPAHTTAGDHEPDLQAFEVRNHTAGSGSEVFLVDHDLPSLGGAGTHGVSPSGWITLSDRGSNDLLLAHELGHLMGFGDWIHYASYARGTVLEASRSNNTPNPDVITGVLCGMVSVPDHPSSACFHADPDPALPPPAPAPGH